MSNCSFENVSWTFEGSAALTLEFLRGLYHGAGEGGKKLIENTFEMIRRLPTALTENAPQVSVQSS